MSGNIDWVKVDVMLARLKKSKEELEKQIEKVSSMLDVRMANVEKASNIIEETRKNLDKRLEEHDGEEGTTIEQLREGS